MGGSLFYEYTELDAQSWWKKMCYLLSGFLSYYNISFMITPLGGYFPFISEQFGNISHHDIYYTYYFSEQSPTFIVKKYIWIMDGLTKQNGAARNVEIINSSDSRVTITGWRNTVSWHISRSVVSAVWCEM